MDYRNSGVDIEAGYKSVELMKKFVRNTVRPEVMGGIGGFSGAFSAAAFKNMEHPVLLSGTDGVGTKLKLAFLMDKHDTVGIDCVAMCVNDVICSGAKPMFFLDYIACGKNAGILAAKILAVSDPELLAKLEAFTEDMKNEVVAKDAKLQEIGYEAYLKEKK